MWLPLLSALPSLMGCQMAAPGTTYRGVLVCTEVPGSPPTMGMRMTVHVTGKTADYNHETLDASQASMGIVEVGGGPVSGGNILLRGAVTLPGLSVKAGYDGTAQDDTLRLRGVQSWTHYMSGLSFNWPCNGSLQRQRG
jgi:ribosomal protein L27